MTITIPESVLWTLGGLIGIPIVAFVAYCFVLGVMFWISQHSK
jgi:hypothetical protein